MLKIVPEAVDEMTPENFEPIKEMFRDGISPGFVNVGALVHSALQLPMDPTRYHSPPLSS